MSNYLNSKPKRYRRTYTQHLIQTFFDSRWGIWLIVAIVIFAIYTGVIMWLDDYFQNLDKFMEARAK